MATIREVLQHAWKLHQRGQLAAAESIYRQILAQAPGSTEAHVYLGIALFDQHRFEESVASYRAALKIQPQFPIGWNNLGNSLRMLNQIEEADACFATAIQQQPDYLSPFKNRGTLWIWNGEVERGLEWYEKGLQLSPQEPELHRNLGVIYLLLGDEAKGWEEYRWRWQVPGLQRPASSAPLWQGEPLEGKSIFLYPEQGLGDAIHFVRMAKQLRSLGARTVLGCESKMVPLLSSAPGIDQVCPGGMIPANVDFQASLIEAADHVRSLPVEPDPAVTPYLSVSDSLLQYWNQNLPARSNETSKRIGICWQGNPNHHADVYRSVPLQEFAPLLEGSNCDWFSLQHGVGSEQLQECDFADRIQRLPDNIDQTGGAFLDTAAILCQMDLVITTDTSTAHLAGALNVPVWVVLGKVPDWRWGLKAETTHWYPSMRLFRQTTTGDWGSVFAAIRRALDTI